MTRGFTSTELLLLAHDEWKRRAERKYNGQYIVTEGQLLQIIEWLSGKKFEDCDVDSMLCQIRKQTTEPRWVSGFLGGFCTSRTWAREYVDKLMKEEKKE